MAKRVTISVSDDLYEKMQKWKDSLNFSGIFQEAISSRIEKKEKYENFKQQTKEDLDMDKTIERLKKQKAESQKEFFEAGKKDGYEYAKNMDYDDFQYVLQYETTNELLDRERNVFGYDPFKGDGFFEEYLLGTFKDDELMGWEETHPGYYFPNEYFREWESGVKEGIIDFWNEIKDKL